MNEDINFEDAMKQLESIANELEKGNSAEKKITMLINDGGEIKEDNFVPKED